MPSVQQAETNLENAEFAVDVAADALEQAQSAFPPNSAEVAAARAEFDRARQELIDAQSDFEDAVAATDTADNPYAATGEDVGEADIVITTPNPVDVGVTNGTGFTPDVPVDPGILSAVEAQRRAGVASTDDAGLNIFGGSDGDVEGVSFDPAVLVPDNDPAISSLDDTGIGDFQATINTDIIDPTQDPAFDGIDDLGIEGFQATIDDFEAATEQGLLDTARRQAAVRDLVNANANDWRVKLSLAPGATYLYKTPGDAGILEPLRSTDGVIFPYTPRIDTTYSANYTDYELVHTNYRQYYYKGSRVNEIFLTAEFTAQDTAEADYLLAVIHFFKSATKMFYGQDNERGSPPPIVFLKGLGNYQYNNQPCVIQQFNYNLPDDVDYIRARSVQIAQNQSLQFRKPLAATADYSLSLDSIWARLTGANLQAGAERNFPPASDLQTSSDATYVPTRIQMSIELLPIQSRGQVSNEFSLTDYASGKLLKRGYW